MKLIALRVPNPPAVRSMRYLGEARQNCRAVKTLEAVEALPELDCPLYYPAFSVLRVQMALTTRYLTYKADQYYYGSDNLE